MQGLWAPLFPRPNWFCARVLGRRCHATRVARSCRHHHRPAARPAHGGRHATRPRQAPASRLHAVARSVRTRYCQIVRSRRPPGRRLISSWAFSQRDGQGKRQSSHDTSPDSSWPKQCKHSPCHLRNAGPRVGAPASRGRRRCPADARGQWRTLVNFAPFSNPFNAQNVCKGGLGSDPRDLARLHWATNLAVPTAVAAREQ